MLNLGTFPNPTTSQPASQNAFHNPVLRALQGRGWLLLGLWGTVKWVFNLGGTIRRAANSKPPWEAPSP